MHTAHVLAPKQNKTKMNTNPVCKFVRLYTSEPNFCDQDKPRRFGVESVCVFYPKPTRVFHGPLYRGGRRRESRNECVGFLSNTLSSDSLKHLIWTTIVNS